MWFVWQLMATWKTGSPHHIFEYIGKSRKVYLCNGETWEQLYADDDPNPVSTLLAQKIKNNKYIHVQLCNK